ncbi:hypothetical protein DFJ43DRAFT_1228483 [Lentinula guzmanii]|uniref:Uncharacterized protein n=1 Tax=Lentinula guzmanii TaxID=2804957 RepID=A0AA38J9C9_9AGAR|nr:hypothetical protein DFJ43DRAFT_1228483 [Lentinula guzmanii]
MSMPSSPPPSIDAPSLPLSHPLSLSQSQASHLTNSVIAIAEEPLNDPPPPYPSSSHRTRLVHVNRGTRSIRRDSQQQQRSQVVPPTESDIHEPHQRSVIRAFAVEDPTEDAASETTPLLGGINSGHPESPSSTSHLRPRSLSQSSINSFAPSLASLAQTAWVFFSECEDDEGGEGDGERGEEREGEEESRLEGGRPTDGEENDYVNVGHSRISPRRSLSTGVELPNLNQTTHHPRIILSSTQARWARYFRPLTRPVYWRSLTHLVLVNFPFALAAWVYLFVFTVTGTTLLIALPLGAILCFFNLLGARAFSRAELFIQTRFHSPLHYPLSVLHAAASSPTTTSSSPITHLIATYPIFTRSRHPSASELESGQAVVGEEVTEMSFYKNTYSMFTDPTSFQALFYFLVIKPAITLLFITFFLTICVPLLVLVIPAPVVLRVCRRIGRWQAVVAVEGLVIGVR